MGEDIEGAEHDGSLVDARTISRRAFVRGAAAGVGMVAVGLGFGSRGVAAADSSEGFGLDGRLRAVA